MPDSIRRTRFQDLRIDGEAPGNPKQGEIVEIFRHRLY